MLRFQDWNNLVCGPENARTENTVQEIYLFSVRFLEHVTARCYITANYYLIL